MKSDFAMSRWTGDSSGELCEVAISKRSLGLMLPAAKAEQISGGPIVRDDRLAAGRHGLFGLERFWRPLRNFIARREPEKPSALANRI